MALTIQFLGCTEDQKVEPAPFQNPNLVSKANTTDGKYQISILSNHSFQLGYNLWNMEVEVLSSGESTEPDEWNASPIMEMHSSAHGSFSEIISTGVENQGAAVFQMPEGSGMSWKIILDLKLDGVDYSMDMPVEVPSSDMPNLASFVSSKDSQSYFLSIANINSFSVGSNELDILVFKKESMMDWPAAEDLVVSFEPSMPSMGHGSPNNLDPVHSGKGHYLGKVNFTMTGVWRLDFTIYQESKKIGECFIDLDLQ